MTKMEIDNLIDNLEKDLRKNGQSNQGRREYRQFTEVRKYQSPASPTLSATSTSSKAKYYSEKTMVFPPLSASQTTEVVKEDTPITEVRVSSVPVKAKAKIFDKIVTSETKQDRESRPISRSSYKGNMAVARLRYRSTSSQRAPHVYEVNRGQRTRRSESSQRKQEFFRHRDSQHGKPLPGFNQFIGTSWPNGLDQAGKTGNADAENEIPYHRYPKPTYSSQPSSEYSVQTPSPEPLEEPPIKSILIKKQESTPPSPIPDYMRDLKLMELNEPPSSNVIPPRFGTLNRRKYPNTAEGPQPKGPPCGLCYEPIEENRCIVLEGVQYHFWHYTCSYCSVTLKENDFIVTTDNKPFCTNCYRRLVIPH